VHLGSWVVSTQIAAFSLLVSSCSMLFWVMAIIAWASNLPNRYMRTILGSITSVQNVAIQGVQVW
jgi:hypothetical protein